MKLTDVHNLPITENDPMTAAELFALAHLCHVPESLQSLTVAHQIDQQDAMPSLAEQAAQVVRSRTLRLVFLLRRVISS